MQHLFAGYSVRGIAAAPFRPETLFATRRDETLHGVPMRFAPCVAGYVGGDITAGLLAAGLAELPGEHLFLDIGTNGEMALGGRGGFVCCAVASGPAFEGAGITCGMPGVDGAVSRVRYDRGFLYDVIGGGEPKGLCGSGLLDLTAVLLRLGVIAPGGRLLPPEDAPESLRRCLTRDDDGNGRFHLTPEVYLTAADVRNLQLAKAAVAAGIRVLLQQRGITPEQVDGVYLAGGFGSYLDPESAMAIGMLPRACAGRLHTLGNTALAGAARARARPCAVAAHRRYFPGMQLSGAVRPRGLCCGLYWQSVISAAITFHGGHNMEIRFPLILDGATGTELQKHGYAGDVSAEQWTLEHPDVIVGIQRGYVAAGSQVLYTPTFGANRQKLEERSIFNQTADYNRRLAALSREAADGRRGSRAILRQRACFLLRSARRRSRIWSIFIPNRRPGSRRPASICMSLKR